jgi:hypothetical protein
MSARYIASRIVIGVCVALVLAGIQATLSGFVP